MATKFHKTALKGSYGIQSRLIGLLIVMLIPILCIQAFVHHDRLQIKKAEELENNSEVSRAMGRAFGALIQDILHNELAIAIAATSSPPLSQKDLTRLLEQSYKDFPAVSAYSWISPQGRVVASSRPGLVGMDSSDRSYFTQIASGRDWVVSDLFRGRVSGKPVFAVSRGIRDERGELLGLVLAGIMPERLDSALAFERPGDAGVSLIDSKGMHVYRCPAVEMTWEQRNWLKLYPALGEAIEGTEVVTTVVSGRTGIKRLVSFTPVSSIGWVSAASRSEKEAMQPVISSLLYHGGMSLGVALASFLVALWMSRAIARPIEKIHEHVLTLGRGEWNARVVVSGPRETRALADALNWMAMEREQAEQELLKSRDELERRVQERTAELNRRAEQLSKLSSQLTLAEQRERRRLAVLIHDHLQQLLVGAKIRLELMSRRLGSGDQKDTEQVYDLLVESLRIARSLSSQLAPTILYERGLAEALTWLARTIQENYGIEVETAMDPQVAPDREDLRVLLFESARELLFNAVKHSRASSARITMFREGDNQLCITVSDQGVGFDPEETLKVLGENRFGLFSIRERLELIGGRLEIESSAGHGSTFRLIVPVGTRVAEGPSQAFEIQTKEAVPGSAEEKRKIRILLVDDHVVMRQGLSSMLHGHPDIEVIGEAADGEEAVQMARDLQPDIVLMDISMPKMNGIDATRMIHSESPQIRIIGLSMYDEAETTRAILDAGAAAFLTKSGRSDALLAAIRGGLDKRGRE